MKKYEKRFGESISKLPMAPYQKLPHEQNQSVRWVIKLIQTKDRLNR